MATRDGLTDDIFGVIAPDRENVVAAPLRAALTPKHQKRDRQLAATVGAVVGQIDRSAGAVLVTGRTDRLGVPEAAQIFTERVGLQLRRIAQQLVELVAQKELGLRA